MNLTDEDSCDTYGQNTSCTEALLADFSLLYTEGILADTTLCVGPSQRQFRVHRAVLACRCEYFRNMFTSGMLEAHQNTIEIPNKNPDVFAVLLDYFYTAKTKITPENAFEVMRLADEYGVLQVKEQCIDYVQHQIDSENAFEVLEESRFHKYSALTQSCTEFIEQNAKKLFRTEGFKNLSRQSLIYLLQSNKLMLHELELFSCVIEWGLHQLRMDTNVCSCDNLPKGVVDQIFFEVPIELIDPYLATKIQTADYNPLSSASSTSPHLPSARFRFPHACELKEEEEAKKRAAAAQDHHNEDSDDTLSADSNSDRSSTLGIAGSTGTSSMTEMTPRAASITRLTQDIEVLNAATGGKSSARRGRSGSGSSKKLRRRGASISEGGEDEVGRSQMRGKKNEEILDALKNVLKDVVRYVRFPTLTPAEIFDFVERTQVVPTELILEAYRYHSLQDQRNRLPDMGLRTRTREGSLFYHPGVLENVDMRWLRGWTLCYHKPYSDRTTADIFSKCVGTRILVAAKHKNSTKLALCAMGCKDKATRETFEHETVLENNVYWYNWPNHAFGFSSTANINLGSADLADGVHKLSWHLTGRGGYRCGEIKTLNESQEWEKLVFWA